MARVAAADLLLPTDDGNCPQTWSDGADKHAMYADIRDLGTNTAIFPLGG